MSKYYISLLGFFMSVHLLMAQNGFIERITSETGSFKDDMVIDFKDDLGHEGYLPISILKGETDGPVFTVVAGVHGYEYPPIVATQSIVKSVDLKTLKGTLIVIPIANTASFFSRTPFVNPQDNKNLNNAFPGKENGTITEQIAHFITTNIIPVSDVFLDIHGGDACEDLIPFVCYYNNEKQPEQTALAKTLSDKSGFEYVVSYPYTILDTEPAKYAFKQAVQDRKTALSIECGKLGNVQDENVNLIKKGVFNMLAAMNMYAVEIEPHQDVIYLNEQYYVKATKQGVFYSTYKAGDKVKKDAVIGYTTDVFGKVIEEYTAPNDGLILYKLATPPINVGDTVMCISSLN